MLRVNAKKMTKSLDHVGQGHKMISQCLSLFGMKFMPGLMTVSIIVSQK